MIIYIFIVIAIGIQMIYIRYADLPFYYKEIMYDWNYTTTKNTKISNNEEWVCLLWNKSTCVTVKQNIENLYGLQTNLFSFQKDIEIHNHLNTIILTISVLICLYLFYITINTFTYRHENRKIKKILSASLIFLIAIIGLYNTEIITTIMYKINFLYTDNIYLTNQNKFNTNRNMVVGILLFVYYQIEQIKERKRTISRYHLYLLYIMINMIDENIVIGIEYIYLMLYTEIIILIITIVKNKRTDG